jgi:hypothetical protein
MTRAGIAAASSGVFHQMYLPAGRFSVSISCSFSLTIFLQQSIKEYENIIQSECMRANPEMRFEIN